LASEWPLGLSIALLLIAAVLITAAGSRLVRLADVLADRTGLGEALYGALFLGFTTSLPGIVTTFTAAAQGLPVLAVSNALGGVAAQLAVLAIADLVYRRANLEHAAASLENLLHASLLIILLAVVTLGFSSPNFTLWGVHPVSFLLLAGVYLGIRILGRARRGPMWQPYLTGETRHDVPDDTSGEEASLSALWLRFAALALLVAASGWLVARSGASIAHHTGLSETVVGALFTGIVTSMPELVTTVAAVRRGALTLAVGDIIGGNAFDVASLAAADIIFRGGSLYHAVLAPQQFMASLALFLVGILLLGLLSREKHGVGNIGFESALVLLFYGVGVTLLFLMQ
jgi:cation:H+ antiporter